MPRFFVEGEPQGEYFLGGEDGRHAARALRLRAGEPVTLCDGQGWDYPCTVLRGEDGVHASEDPATRALTTERLTHDYPRHATSLLNLIKNAEETMQETTRP